MVFSTRNLNWKEAPKGCIKWESIIRWRFWFCTSCLICFWFFSHYWRHTHICLFSSRKCSSTRKCMFLNLYRQQNQYMESETVTLPHLKTWKFNNMLPGTNLKKYYYTFLCKRDLCIYNFRLDNYLIKCTFSHLSRNLRHIYM